MSDYAPIELYGFHPEMDVILARREGEPDFVWVQDIGDAVMAAAARGVDVVIPAKFLAELRSAGELPPEWLPSRIVVK